MKKRKSNIILYLLLLCFGITALIPFQYMIATSMTPKSYSMPYPPILFPKKLYLKNYVSAWLGNNFGDYFFNSILVGMLSTGIIMFVSTTSGYAFARLKFKGRELLFYIYLFSMMVPTVTNLIPQFLLVKHMHLIDSYAGLILVYVGIGVPSNTFFLRNFFLSIPKELEEAVVMDGGKKWTIYRHIVLPLSKPAIGTFAVLAFSNVWDEFLIALTLIKSPDKRTLPIAIKLFQGQHLNDWGLIFAASLIAVIPILLIYILMQKRLIKGGVTEGMIKG